MNEHLRSADYLSDELLLTLFQQFLDKHKELSEQIGLTEKSTDAQINVPGWTYFPKSSNIHLHLIDTCSLLKRHNLNLQGKNLLDFGCGSGRVINFLSWLYEVKGMGIELYPLIARESNLLCQRLKEEKGFEGVNTEVVAGNFFPSDFKVPIRVKWWKVRKPKRAALEGNPYEELGVAINEVDIFYFYQFSINTPWILKLLAERARAGAQIIFADYELYAEKVPLPDNLKIVEVKGRVALLSVV